MDLFDLASRRQQPDDSTQTKVEPLAVHDQTDHKTDACGSDSTSPWVGTAQELWGAPQKVAAQQKPAETFDATPPKPNSADDKQQQQTADAADNPLLAQTKTDKPAEPVRPAEIRPAGIDLQKSMAWLEKAVQLSDKTDTKAAALRVSEGQKAGLDLVEVLTNPKLSAEHRRVIADMNLRVHAEKFQDYAKYLDPALARAELALAKISSGDEKQIAEGERTLIEAVSRRPELQVDAAFNRKVLSAYHQMETSRKTKGLPAWSGELKPATAADGTVYATTAIDDAMDKANEAYGDKGIKAAIPHFETAIKAADVLPQDKINKELTELFCKRVTIERSIIAKELRGENVDKLVADHQVAKDNEWNKYRDHLAPGATRVNLGLAMIASGEADMLKRGKAMLGEAIAKRPELEFSVDYMNHLKKAFEAHHQNKPAANAEKPTAPAAAEKPGAPAVAKPGAPASDGPGARAQPEKPAAPKIGAGGIPEIPGLDTRNPTPPPAVADRMGLRADNDAKTKLNGNDPNKPMDKFQVGYKKFETKDLGKAATEIEKDKEVVSYTSDVVTGPVLTVACLYLGYKVAQGRLEAIRARRAAAAASTASPEAATSNGGTGIETKPEQTKPNETNPSENKPGETKTPGGESKPPQSKSTETPGTTGDTKTDGTPKPPGEVKPADNAPPAEAKPSAPNDVLPATAKPTVPSDVLPATAKPQSTDTGKLTLPERVNAAPEEIQPGLKKLLKLARSPENRNKHYDRLVNDLLELDKGGKLDSTMKAYLKQEMVRFLNRDGIEGLQEYVDIVKAKTPPPTEAMKRPPITQEQRLAATESAFREAAEAIRTYEQTDMTKNAKDYTNKILEKYFPGVEATEVFAGGEGLAVRLNDGTVLKFRPNTEWDANWGHRQLDMPLLSIDGGEPRPMLVGPEGKQWVVYRQPYGETPDPAKVQDFIKAVKRAQGNTGDFGRAVDAAARQVGNYTTPEGRVEVRTFDYSALEVDRAGDHDFTEQDTLDLSKPKPAGAETATRGPETTTSRSNPDATKPDGAKPDGPKPDGSKPDGTKPDGTKPDGTKPDGTKPDGAKPDAPKPDAAKTEAPRPGTPEGGRPQVTTPGSDAAKPPTGGNANLSKPGTAPGGNIDDIPIETSPFEQGSQEQPKIERPGAAMEAAKMIEIKLPGGLTARMAKADAPKYLDRLEKEFKTGDFGKVLDEMLSDKSRTEEEKTELRDLKARYDQLPADAKEECKAEFFANLRTQLGIKTETTEAERGRTSRVGRTLAIGGGVLAVGILSTAVLRHMLQRDATKHGDRIQVEFKKDK